SEETTLVTFQYAFETEGTHAVYAYVDSEEDVIESNEGNNASPVLWVTVGTGTAPTPTSTPTATPTGTIQPPGAIDGYTWIFIGGAVVPHGRTDVYCYEGSNLIAQTVSDDQGYYSLNNIPPGTNYTVIGSTIVDEIEYRDTRTGVTVTSGNTTRVNLLLLPQY
ncbi:MAG TPA: hypothetical protein EYP49_12945, partial [Anaerolineae bacterium]|nr:hypothetical protein [Anaerolineae bacterium]